MFKKVNSRFRNALCGIAAEPHTIPGQSKVRWCAAVALLAISGSVVYGQDLKSLGTVYRPDEPVHVRLTFDGPVDLTRAWSNFSLVKLNDESQRLWTSSFTTASPKKVGPTEYEVSGSVPTYAASGVYRLVAAYSAVSDLTKDFNIADILHKDITITVVNDKHDPLPALKDAVIVGR